MGNRRPRHFSDSLHFLFIVLLTLFELRPIFLEFLPEVSHPREVLRCRRVPERVPFPPC